MLETFSWQPKKEAFESVFGKFSVNMKLDIDKILSEAPPEIKGVAQTPTGEHLYKVNPKCKHLDASSAMMCTRPGILTVVAFLTTWIQ